MSAVGPGRERGAAVADRPAEVMIYVQHLLGIGHLTRAASIARACAAAGLSTALVSGGPPLPRLPLGEARLVQLPPLRSRDAAFSALVDAEGREIDEAFKAERRARLLAAFEALAPRVLMIELYPFGRRMLRFELEPLVAAARERSPRPWILCSLRDVLNPSDNPKKADWTLERVRTAFDLVLVHGDPELAPLVASFPHAAAIADRLRYTGYVVAESQPAADTAGVGDGEGEVLVSTGGGAVGQALIETALAARERSPLRDRPWRILVGESLEAAAFERLRAAAPEGMIVERARADFRALLARARLSISQGGYNTVMEILQAGLPAVVVPFETAGEQEQRLRAELLAARGLLTLLPAERLAPDALAGAIGQALGAKAAVHNPVIDVAGASNTAKIVAELAAIVPD